jgi:hypothetical protein
MSELKDNIYVKIMTLHDDLKIERDEIKVKLSLMKLELRDKWEHVEIKWNSFKTKVAIIEDSVEDAGSDISHGLLELGKEIKHAYKDVKKGIESSKLAK